jgi:hypothetical protein
VTIIGFCWAKHVIILSRVVLPHGRAGKHAELRQVLIELRSVEESWKTFQQYLYSTHHPLWVAQPAVDQGELAIRMYLAASLPSSRKTAAVTSE